MSPVVIITQMRHHAAHCDQQVIAVGIVHPLSDCGLKRGIRPGLGNDAGLQIESKDQTCHRQVVIHGYFFDNRIAVRFY